MKLRPVLVLSLWLVGGTVLPTHAQLPLSQTSTDYPCDVSTVASGRREGQGVMATVKRIDPSLGQLEFTTETGSFLLTTTAALDDLHVGDQLLLCLHEDGSEDKDRIVKIPLQRTTESPEGHDRAGRDDR